MISWNIHSYRTENQIKTLFKYVGEKKKKRKKNVVYCSEHQGRANRVCVLGVSLKTFNRKYHCPIPVPCCEAPALKTMVWGWGRGVGAGLGGGWWVGWGVGVRARWEWSWKPIGKRKAGSQGRWASTFTPVKAMASGLRGIFIQNHTKVAPCQGWFIVT